MKKLANYKEINHKKMIKKIISFEPRYKRKVKRKLEKMSENTCVCCGEIIPEGRQYCINCGNVTKCEPINDLLLSNQKRQNTRNDKKGK